MFTKSFCRRSKTLFALNFVPAPVNAIVAPDGITSTLQFIPIPIFNSVRNLSANTEFGDIPICRASRLYQKKKLRQLSESDLPAEQVSSLTDLTTVKSCICHDLGGGAQVKLGIDPNANPAVCTGPNIAYFSKIATLEEMIGHIYQVAGKIAHDIGISEDGFRIVNNCNEAGGQIVWHIHFHLLGGRDMLWPPG